MAATGTAPARVPTEAPRVSPLDAANMTAGTAAKIGMGIFGVVLVVGMIFIGRQLIGDLSEVHATSIMPYLLLGLALLVALGFEFVNGFHDTANAVATVIYTHTLEPHVAVVWSGLWNFTGVVLSSGAVAFGIVSLLPVELILQVGGKAGFSMVFALLFAAIIWNLGTWYFGLPASSSHTLIGSIIGVGIANQLMSVKTGTSGVDWGQAANIGKSLLLSPIVGFICAALLLMACKALIPNKALYEAPKGNEPPPFYIRALLVLTCTGVSFFHGSNDGQKGMGLIMLILIGTVPTAYAVNHAVTTQQTADFVAVSTQTADALSHYVSPSAVVGDSREEVTDYIRTEAVHTEHDAGVARVDQRNRNGNGAVQTTEGGAARSGAQLPQRYVRGERGAALDEENRRTEIQRGGFGDHRELQKAHRQCDQVHSDLGESGGGAGARAWNDDRMEANRGDRRRENRERSPDLRAGRGRGDHGDGNDWSSRRVRPPCEYNARAVVRCSGNDDGESFRAAMGHGAEFIDGVGAHAARIDHAGWILVLAFPQNERRLRISSSHKRAAA